MLLIIEHSGSADHNKIVKEMEHHIESEFGFTVETIIGDENSAIILYNDMLNEIARFTKMPNYEALDFYIRNYIYDM